jgi:hypothetical protein
MGKGTILTNSLANSAKKMSIKDIKTEIKQRLAVWNISDVIVKVVSIPEHGKEYHIKARYDNTKKWREFIIYDYYENDWCEKGSGIRLDEIENLEDEKEGRRCLFADFYEGENPYWSEISRQFHSVLLQRGRHRLDRKRKTKLHCTDFEYNWKICGICNQMQIPISWVSPHFY